MAENVLDALRPHPQSKLNGTVAELKNGKARGKMLKILLGASIKNFLQSMGVGSPPHFCNLKP